MHQVMHTARIPMHTLGVFSGIGKKRAEKPML